MPIAAIEPPSSGESKFAILSIHRTDTIRFTNFPDALTETAGFVIRLCWLKGVMSEGQHGPSYEWRLRGSPFGVGGDSDDSLAQRMLMRDLLALLYANRWVHDTTLTHSHKPGAKDALVFRRRCRPAIGAAGGHEGGEETDDDPPAVDWLVVSFGGADKLRLFGADQHLLFAVRDTLATQGFFPKHGLPVLVEPKLPGTSFSAYRSPGETALEPATPPLSPSVSQRRMSSARPRAGSSSGSSNGDGYDSAGPAPQPGLPIRRANSRPLSAQSPPPSYFSVFPVPPPSMPQSSPSGGGKGAATAPPAATTPPADTTAQATTTSPAATTPLATTTLNLNFGSPASTSTAMPNGSSAAGGTNNAFEYRLLNRPWMADGTARAVRSLGLIAALRETLDAEGWATYATARFRTARDGITKADSWFLVRARDWERGSPFNEEPVEVLRR